MTTIFGIKNCDTMKKAFKWMDDNAVKYDFHDYKKHGVDEDILQKAMNMHGWENVINRRGTSWRKLSDDVKEMMNSTRAIGIAIENPSIIKRPMLVKGDKILLGFDPQLYEASLK